MVVGENKRTNIMDGIENTGDVRLHDHRLRLKQRFDIVRKLGQGTYGKVQLGINKKTGQEVAIKTIKKCKIESEADLIRIRREVQIMSSVRHPNIVHIYEVFENSEKMILVMEYCSGGELYDYLSQKKVLQEDEARRLFRQIATAVYYCHIHKICHRDLKLENVLVDDTGSAKIADFGLSNVFKETSLLSTFCGSPLYASPEIVKGTPYIGPEVDCWSLGVLLYTLVYGAMPFDGSNFKRLVRQISNGDYYEPKNPSTASPLIRDMLTVDPLKRADITYICDHSWVNTGYSESCLEVAEALAAQTPVRLDLLLSLAPAAPSHSNSVLVPPAPAPHTQDSDLGPEESGTDLTNSASMAVEPSNSAEKRILELVAEGGEDAIKPSPTRTIVSAGDNKRKLEIAMSASGLQRKKEKVGSCANIGPKAAVPEEPAADIPEDNTPREQSSPLCLKSSATITIQPAVATVPAPPPPLVKDTTREIKPTQPQKDKDTPKESPPKEEDREKTGAKPRVSVKKKASVTKLAEEKAPEKVDETKDETKPSSVASAADKMTSLTLSQPTNQTPKPKKLSIPGGNVGSFKEQFERRASLTSAPEVKRNVTKPVSKIAKPKAQSEDRELSSKAPDNGSVRLQQIGIEPSPAPQDEGSRGGVKKTESEPAHTTTSVDPSVLLQDARRSLQNSMAKLVEERAGEDRRRAARDIISTAIRTGKPPVPYGRSSSAGVASLASPPGTPPAAPAAPAPATPTPRVFRTEAQHKVEDHRNRGVSVERIIPINLASEESPTSPPPKSAAQPAVRPVQPPLRRLVSNESTTSETCASPSGEPIKKSAREFIIPIAVEGKGYVTPRQRSLEPDTSSTTRLTRTPKPRRISSLVSGGESEEEDDSHMHRLRSTRAARAESVSSGEEDEEDEGFHLLTAENLFSTLLHRVRALTNRLNGEEGPGFQHPHSLFNNLHQSPFFNSPHLPRRHLLREGWGSRDLHADLESMFNSPRAPLPRGSSKKSDTGSRACADPDAEAETEGDALSLSDLDLSSISLSERELRALSGLTPALTRRLQRQLLAHLPPAAARTLRRTLSLRAAAPPPAPAPAATTAPLPATAPATPTAPPASQYCTLPRVRRDADPMPPAPAPARCTPERPLLSKYLTPERAMSLDDSYSSDGGSALSETSSGARRSALGPAPSPAPAPVIPPAVFTDVPRKRISRFLRSDFFDTPPDESVYQKHKKEKELETQKILREIREKKNKALETVGGRSGGEAGGDRTDELIGPRKCLSPISPVALLASKERSRSGTPFFPMLDNIKESAADGAPAPAPAPTVPTLDTYLNEESPNLDTKSLRPKSYPVKNVETFDEGDGRVSVPKIVDKEKEAKEKTLPRESKLIRPKSYPTSSPSPEKISLARPAKKDEIKNSAQKIHDIAENNNDVEVSFSIALPKKKTTIPTKLDTFRKSKSLDTEDTKVDTRASESTLVLKKYQVVNNIGTSNNTEQNKSHKIENGTAVTNGLAEENACKSMDNDNSKSKGPSGAVQTVEVKDTSAEAEEKKVTKKKVIKKVSSKSKADAGTSKEATEVKAPVEKKKVTKKVKDKSVEDGTKPITVTKKKSVLQSIGHKLEKLASNNKSSSPEKAMDSNVGDAKKDKASRAQREQSVPAGGAGGAGGGEAAGGVQRAATLADVAALAAPSAPPARTTVSKVLGLFKKFDPKDKVPKTAVEKSPSDSIQSSSLTNGRVELQPEPAPCPAPAPAPAPTPAADPLDADKPRRPTSLLLNGLGRRAKYGRTASDSLPLPAADEDAANKNEIKSRNLRNSLKLDFSRLPRVKKIVPTNPVIEPLLVSVESDEKDCERKSAEKNGPTELESPDRSRSRSRSTFSNSEMKSDNSAEIKFLDKNPLSPLEGSSHSHQPVRNHESTTPEKEDIIERIRRKSFYSRFNEKKQRRRSNLVGPGAVEYDPVARIHAPPPGDLSPAPAPAPDLSPGTYSGASDLSPGTDRYRALLSDLPAPASVSSVPAVRTALRYDTYGLNDKIDTYRSLDRNDFRKYSGARTYLDYDQPSSYTGHRYSRTRSLLDADGGPDEVGLISYRDPLKYNRTLSMYSPGSYATYRPKRTLNSAIILKESEKEPSPENILEKIRNRKKISISVTRKPDLEKDPLPRSDVSSKGEGDGPKCIEKTD